MLENHPKEYLTMKTIIEYKDGKSDYALLYSLTITLNKNEKKREKKIARKVSDSITKFKLTKVT